MMVDVLFDIDGTLSWQGQLDLYKTYRKYFKLDITDERLLAITDINEFDTLPESIAFKDRVGQVKYDFLKQVVMFDPGLLRAANVISHSVNGVKAITQHAQAGYCTARRGMTEQWTTHVQKATRAWLQEKSFPRYRCVAFCEGPEGKLHYIANRILTSPHTIVLIDDLYSSIITFFSSLNVQEQEALRTHFILGAYGTIEPIAAPFQVIPLPSWKNVEPFVQELKGCSTWQTKRKKARALQSTSRKLSTIKI